MIVKNVRYIVIPTSRCVSRCRCISRCDICVQVARAQTALEAFTRRQCYGLNKQCDARSNWYDDWRYSDQHCCLLFVIGCRYLLVPASIVQVVHWPSVFTDSAYVFVSDANSFGQSAVCLLFRSSEHCVCVCVCCICVFVYHSWDNYLSSQNESGRGALGILKKSSVDILWGAHAK